MDDYMDDNTTTAAQNVLTELGLPEYAYLAPGCYRSLPLTVNDDIEWSM